MSSGTDNVGSFGPFLKEEYKEMLRDKMNMEPCVVCGEDSVGARKSFLLCKEHLDEVDAEEARRIEFERKANYLKNQERFRREYPGIVIGKRQA